MAAGDHSRGLSQGFRSEGSPDSVDADLGSRGLLGGVALTENNSSPSPQHDSDSGGGAEGKADGGSRRRTRIKVLRFAGLGTELAACTLTVAGIGYVIDSVRGHQTAYATAVGTMIGYALGMLRFFREVKKHSKD